MWTRRRFLQTMGLGAGATLFTPLLHQMFAQGATLMPRRFVIFVEGNGIEPRSFLSAPTQAAIEAAASKSIQSTRYFYRDYKHDAPLITAQAQASSARALRPLAASPGQVELNDRAAVVFGLSHKISGGGHSTECGALSCTRSQIGVPAGQTIDDYLANLSAVRQGAPFDAVRLGVSSGAGLNYSTCAYGPRRPAAITTSPSNAFSMLFGSVAQGAGRRNFQKRNDLLDFAATDARRVLASFSGSSIERQKLEAYLTSLENLTTRQSILADMEEALNAVKPPEPDTSPLYSATDPLDRLIAQVDLATAALIGGLTHVIVIAVGTGTANFSLDYTSLLDLYPERELMGGHDVRHGAEKGNAQLLELLYTVTTRQVEQMARMARALAATPEVGHDGSMLDHTLLMYMSDNGEKHHSNADEWPMLLLGGDKLGFKTDGRSVVFPKVGHSNNRQVSNLMNTLGHAAGQDLNTFGAEGEQRIAQGPLSELWG